jgi:hypothetical protein
VQGSISLIDHTIHLDFVETKELGSIRSLLKKGEKGWYYETSF